MTARTVKLYPSATQFQRSDEDEVPLVWAVSYLHTLLEAADSDPQATSGSAMIKGWKGVEVLLQRTPTDAELLAERVSEVERRVEVIRNRLMPASSTGGLTADQAKELLEYLDSVK